MDTKETIEKLIQFYGNSSIVPSREQWQSAFSHQPEQTICMVNFMKFREQADYPDGENVSGIEAMGRYTEISHELVKDVGGEFLTSGMFGGILIGEEESWDGVGIVRYPDIHAFLSMFMSETYQNCHRHRVAATLRHRMAILVEI